MNCRRHVLAIDTATVRRASRTLGPTDQLVTDRHYQYHNWTMMRIPHTCRYLCSMHLPRSLDHCTFVTADRMRKGRLHFRQRSISFVRLMQDLQMPMYWTTLYGPLNPKSGTHLQKVPHPPGGQCGLCRPFSLTLSLPACQQCTDDRMLD